MILILLNMACKGCKFQFSANPKQTHICWRNNWQYTYSFFFSQFSRSVLPDSLRPHGLQHARPPCPPPFPFLFGRCWWHLWAYTILVPHQGPNPLPLPWECGVQTTGPPGTSLNTVISSSLRTSQISSKVRCGRKEESISFTLWSRQVYRSLYKESNVFVLTKCPLDLNFFF